MSTLASNQLAGGIYQVDVDRMSKMPVPNAMFAQDHPDDHSFPSQDGASPTPEDVAQMWEWNSTVPSPISRTVSQMIACRVQSQPLAPAVCAWDGDLTYGELDLYASQLAGCLFWEYGIGPGILVPLCFEKSRWMTVAILGVIKTGGGFVLLEPTLPRQRLQAILQQVESSLLLCSSLHQHLGGQLVPRAVTISASFFTNIETQPGLPIRDWHSSAIIYAVFTSGSTGKPKGVLITHENAASALYYQVERLGLTAESRLFDFASYGFDGSINNVFTILEAGGCLCVPSDQDRKDNLEQSIVALRANVLDLTPSVAKLLDPERIPAVRLVIFAGEALHAAEATRWWGKVQVCNGYGPSECTPTSTINFDAPSPEEATRIGVGAGLVTWVTDPKDHDILMPLGHVGELLLEGPLVGQGYLKDPVSTSAAFVEDPKWLLRGADGHPGRHGRVYKTGDLVRYFQDGSLAYVSRKDTQIKLRGQRVELSEIEHVLRSHSHVDDAVVILQSDSRQEPQIVGFVTTCKGLDEQLDRHETQHVEAWAGHFDAEAYSSIESLRPDQIGRDFVGWTSMYDGTDIDKVEMDEWLDDTVATIRRYGPLGCVLEIGTGSGMIPLNIGDGLERYIGIEPSRRATRLVNETAERIPTLANKVRVYQGTATDLGQIGISLLPGLVILNSVIQYFPSQEYLFGVLQQLLNLEGVRIIFAGDIRSYPLYGQFLATKAMRTSGESLSQHKLRNMMAEMEKQESELLLDPAFFTSLQKRLPGQIEHIEILPKRMHATNELSCYRYAAVIHCKVQEAEMQLHGQEISSGDWIDFARQGLDRQALFALLQRRSASPIIAISNIPNSKTIFERHTIHALHQAGQSQHGSDWFASVRTVANVCPSLSVVELTELAQQAGYRVEISWARQHTQLGGLDAIFHRQPATGGKQRTMFIFPTDHEGRSQHSFSNQPLRELQKKRTQEDLNQWLKARLPSYMVPPSVVVLDEMPLNKNGKVDRQALANTVQLRPKAFQAPVSQMEQQMQGIWGRILNIDPATIRLDDDFFQIGGNSIAAMRVVGEARKAGLELTVADLFRKPNLCDLVK
jgi:amino acid adenylation domain-containing protein